MSKSAGRIALIVIIWLFSLRYYLECMTLTGRMEKLTVDIAFWLLTLFAAWELFSLVKIAKKEKSQMALLVRRAIWSIIQDKRTHFVLAVIVYVILIPLTGFYLTSFIAFFVFSLLIKSGKETRMIVILSASSLVLAFIYGIFSYLLQISLPTGLLFK